MAVKIEIDLDADEATGKIGAIAASLKGLEQTADDIDIDFDADISDITKEMDKLSEVISDIDSDMDKLSNKVKSAAKDLDGSTVKVVSDSKPDGKTGSGDSTGGDPPGDGEGSGFSKAAGTVGDGGRTDSDIRRNLKKRIADTFDFDFNDLELQDVDISDELDDLDWNELQARASSEGVYGENPSRGELESRLQKKARRVVVDTGDFRRTGIQSAMKAKQGGFKESKSSIPDFDLQDNIRRGGFRSAIKLEGFDVDDIDGDKVKKLKRSFSGIGTAAKRAVPDMNQIYSVIAAIIPLAVVLGAQLLGVAAAMGAVAMAGAAIGGLGLLGHGDSMQESFAEAKNELNDLKDALFKEAQPTMKMFAPIQERMFDAIPRRVGQIADELEGLTAFEDTLFQLGAMLAGGLEYSLKAITENEEAISQLSIRFADIIGSTIIDFFGWLLKEARENQQMLISLGEVLKDFATVIFRVFKVLVMLLDAFSPVTSIILRMSQLLNNNLVQALIVFLGTAYLTISVLTKLGVAALGAYSALASIWTGSMLKTMMYAFAQIQGQIARLISHYTALSGAAASARAAMAMTGIGLVALGAGALAVGSMNSGGGGSSAGGGALDVGAGGGRGGQVYNDNRQYTINAGGSANDYATLKDVEDTVRKTNQANNATQRPSVASETESSDK